VTKKYKDVDIEAAACVHNLQYSSVQYYKCSCTHHSPVGFNDLWTSCV